jgi:Family of unknown function (DUF5994)
MSTRTPSNPDLLRLVPASAKTAPRLYLDPTGSHQSMLDGAWWPQSRNPACELPGLILAIDALRGQVVRLVLAATGWDERPRRMAVGRRAISIDYFGSQPAALLTAICVQSRVDLLVIPPVASPQVAHAAMIHAMSTGNRVIAPRPAMAPDTSRAAKQAAAEEESGAPPHDPRLAGAAASRLG